MISHKVIHLNVWKEYDYIPLSKRDKNRFKEIMVEELESLVNRFDGPVKVTIIYEAKGNC